MFDLYNIFNNDSALSETLRYGSTFQLPRSVLGARMFKLGAQLEF